RGQRRLVLLSGLEDDVAAGAEGGDAVKAQLLELAPQLVVLDAALAEVHPPQEGNVGGHGEAAYDGAVTSFPLPPDLPVPEADGAADHLPGLAVPSLALPATGGGEIDLAELAAGLLVTYVYPRTGTPGEPLPDGWDDIPGARGCTPQSCSYRDALAE